MSVTKQPVQVQNVAGTLINPATEDTISSIKTLLTFDSRGGQIEVPQNKTYILVSSMITNATLTSLVIYTALDSGATGGASGTCTAALAINGTPITGLTSISVTNTKQEVAASALNTLVTGDVLSLVLTNVSAATNLIFEAKWTRS